MDLRRLSAVLLIAAAVGTLLSSFLNAPGLYQTHDIDERLEIIEGNRDCWIASQVVVAISASLMAAGFAILAWTLRQHGSSWLAVAGGAAIGAGTISGLYFVFLQTVDPRGGYSGAYPVPENVAYWLWLAGQLLLGVALLQTDFPGWLGYLTGGTALAYAIAFLLTGAGFMTPFLLALVALLIGIVQLRQ